MARVLLIGCGPLPGDEERRVGFPQIRTAQTLLALRGAGHHVSLVLLGEREHAGPELLCVRPEHGAWLERIAAARRAVAPDVVVTAGPYEPARAAALVVDQEPLWVDVPGDPFAEAQARSAHVGEPDATVWMRAAWGPALLRGDAFGAIGGPQRHALLGQLGWLGRLTGAPPAHDWVGEVPVAVGFPGIPLGPPRERAPGAPLVLALSGGFNTWMDAEGLLDGVLLAMDRDPDLRLVATGGEIPGHHTAGYERFSARVAASPHHARFRLHGWLPQRDLPDALAEAHLGLSLDRPGLEPELGTRTRLLLFNQLGLGLASSLRCALSHELADRGLLVALPVGDPPALAAALVAARAEGQSPERVLRTRAYLEDRYSLTRAYAPLLRWLERPTRTRAGEDPAAQLGAELTLARQELARIHQSTTWRLSAKIKTFVKK